MTADWLELEAALGFTFERRELLARALTHSSRVYEAGLPRHPHSDNEQLEFLGDAVLGLLVAEHLVVNRPDFDEGRLSWARAQLINRSHLAEVAGKLELGKYLVLGRGEELNGGRAKRSLLVNAFEALLGAVYEQGGLDAARRVVEECVIAGADLDAIAANIELNPKCALEDVARGRGWAPPVYKIRVAGPLNALRYSASIELAGFSAVASASTKRGAEQGAAREILKQLG